MTYKGLLLDFGSVIMKSHFETHRAFEKHVGIPAGTLTWRGPFDPSSDPLWADMLANKLTEREYWGIRAREVGALLGEEWTLRDFFLHMNKIPLDDYLRSEALTLAADAKAAGIKVAILTNDLEYFHGREWLDTVPLMQQVDFVYDATHTHILKPDPRSYQMTLAGLNLKADEVIFIDDQPRNVEGGIKAGIRSILLDILDPNAAFLQARRLLNLDK